MSQGPPGPFPVVGLWLCGIVVRPGADGRVWMSSWVFVVVVCADSVSLSSSLNILACHRLPSLVSYMYSISTIANAEELVTFLPMLTHS